MMYQRIPTWKASVYEGALNDNKMSFLFRGLTESSSIERMQLCSNQVSAAGIRSMVPFLQNAANLVRLSLEDNNIKSEGFNFLFRALRHSPIKYLFCGRCRIESIVIDSENIPRHLASLNLAQNSITADGCRELAKLLRGDNAMLELLDISDCKVGDDGVEVLADALQTNTSLKFLYLTRNDDISTQGQIMLLKLVNDVSSIKATLQSNHTLKRISVKGLNNEETLDEIQSYIDYALGFNNNHGNPEAAVMAKVILTQLHSETRAELAALQGVEHSVYSEIDPLHLPEVLSLICRHHGQRELYPAVSSSIMTLFSTINVKKCIQQKKAYHEAIIAENAAIVAVLDAKLVSMDESSGGNESNNELEHRSNKRRRKWWWGLWGGA